MAAEVLDVEHRGDGVVVVTLSRPEKRNALNGELRQALIDTLHDIAVDDDAKAVVLQGSGGSFCAGFDLKELEEAANPADLFAHATTYHHVVYTFAKPLIAAIEGAAVAGGMDLALMCDLRVAASDSRFGQPQVRMGIPAAFDLLATVLAGPVVRDLCLTGRIVGAAEAREIGLVDRMVEPGASLDAAIELAGDIAGSVGAVSMKQAFVAAQPNLFA
jgi:enoyl-CoA hydratase